MATLSIEERLEAIEETKKTFFSLPREIRDKIYKLVAVDEEPITVRHMPSAWNGSSLCSDLLLVSRKVHSEFAYAYYHHNAFFFPGPWGWHSLFLFLHKIGPHNRSHLKALHLNTRKQTMQAIPEKSLYVYDMSHGVMEANLIRPFTARIKKHAKVYDDGCMDFLDPAIEECFELLKDATYVKITMQLAFMIPGMEIDPARIIWAVQHIASESPMAAPLKSYYKTLMTPDELRMLLDENHSEHEFSTALPDYLEELRSIPGRSKVMIIWRASAPQSLLAPEKAFVDAGWTTLKGKRDENLCLVRTSALAGLRLKKNGTGKQREGE